MAAFQEHLPRFQAEDVEVIAASTDTGEHTHALAERLGLTFAVGHGLPLHDTAAALGAFYEDRRQILHATGFLLRPDHTIANATYSTGPIGRLDPVDVLRLVAWWRARE